MADALDGGPYRLRCVITSAEGEESVYATRVGEVGQPIEAIGSAESGLLSDSTSWWLSKAGGDDDTWFIVSHGPFPKGAGHGPVSLGFSNDAVDQGAPIKFGPASGCYKMGPGMENGGRVYVLYYITVYAGYRRFRAISIQVVPADSSDSKDRIDIMEPVIGINPVSGTLEVQRIMKPAGAQLGAPKWHFDKV
ncbi:hypothetical protein FRC09_000151 [Ceratobasidium sp. 395]|nr:hypothetical protein FRC09_000151 [Ceratobasidium sp. 395]